MFYIFYKGGFFMDINSKSMSDLQMEFESSQQEISTNKKAPDLGMLLGYPSVKVNINFRN